MNGLQRSDLHAYQNKAIDFIKDKRKCQLWLEMGLGKTSSTLTAVVDLIDGMAINKVLVIAPLRVANTVWKSEASKWEHTAHLRINICTGSEKVRKEALAAGADVYVINRENVPWLVENPNMLYCLQERHLRKALWTYGLRHFSSIAARPLAEQ